jgi:alpha-D-ribose 1-methylphosphonate 5-triphosphate synthase subunit PhnG
MRTERQRWMSVLARAAGREVEQAWRALGETVRYRVVRGPDVGLVMVRARAGGTGTRFNLGEMTVTRCTVQVDGGALGHAWVGGRDTEHAERAAVLDALLQDPARRPRIEAAVVAPLAAAYQARRRASQERAGETRVDFFTMVRGE